MLFRSGSSAPSQALAISSSLVASPSAISPDMFGSSMSFSTKYAGVDVNLLQYTSYVLADHFVSQLSPVGSFGASQTLSAGDVGANGCARAYATSATTANVFVVGGNKQNTFRSAMTVDGQQRATLGGATSLSLPVTYGKSACLVADGRLFLAGGADLAQSASKGEKVVTTLIL